MNDPRAITSIGVFESPASTADVPDPTADTCGFPGDPVVHPKPSRP